MPGEVIQFIFDSEFFFFETVEFDFIGACPGGFLFDGRIEFLVAAF